MHREPSTLSVPHAAQAREASIARTLAAPASEHQVFPINGSRLTTMPPESAANK